MWKKSKIDLHKNFDVSSSIT